MLTAIKQDFLEFGLALKQGALIVRLKNIPDMVAGVLLYVLNGLILVIFIHGQSLMSIMKTYQLIVKTITVITSLIIVFGLQGLNKIIIGEVIFTTPLMASQKHNRNGQKNTVFLNKLYLAD